LPLHLHLAAWLVLRLRVAPYPALFGRAVRRFRRLPRFLVLWLCRRWIFELPRISHPHTSLVSLIRRVAPLPHALLRRPLTRNLGCPSFRISGLAGDGAPSRLVSRILRRCRVTDLQVAPNSGLSVSPMILPRVAPHPDLPAPADGPPEFPLGSAPSGCACGRTFESPRISAPTGLASSVNFRVAPALYPSGCADRLISRSP
jgi:hypothetical protein